MIRRDFIKGSVAASVLGGCAVAAERIGSSAQASGSAPPNILIILVDEMRPPPGFPDAMPLVWQQNIPNMMALWQESACFTNHFTAASDCSPSRATLVTGMYAQQHWLLSTIINSSTPQLQTAYPTFGTILSNPAYVQTPYEVTWIGKWHLSSYSPDSVTGCPPTVGACAGSGCPSTDGPPPSAYGFSGGTTPDPTGIASQGAVNDSEIASQFTTWLETAPTTTPWCTTVSLVNPHDIQWFWQGTDCPLSCANGCVVCTGSCASSDCVPGAYMIPPVDGYTYAYFQTNYSGYPCGNFENPYDTSTPKPEMQQKFATFTAETWGEISWDLGTLQALMPLPVCTGTGQNAEKPFNYWYKLLQLYLYVQHLVDAQVGVIMNALQSSSFASNTIVIFTSDHGEYAGAHGQRGKGGMAYDEAMRVPFSVYDPTGLYVQEPGVLRTGLTSSVDFAALVATLANSGTTPSWSGPTSYLAPRFPMIDMLASPSAPGRSYVLYSTDEVFVGIDPTTVATHVLSYRTTTAKCNTYSHWVHDGTTIDTSKLQEYELYDYITDGPGEVGNVWMTDPLFSSYKSTLLGSNDQGGLLASDLQGPVDTSLQAAQTAAIDAYLAYAPTAARF